jgi:alpha-1,3-rhamnosyl/mannosyltransferase
MRIVIDARWIFREISGIGLYTQELIRGLAELRAPHDFILIFQDADVLKRTADATDFRANPRFSTQLVDFGLFAPRGQLALPALLKRLGADVYHSTNWMMPLVPCGRTRRVVTVHDLIPLLFRKYAPKSKKERFFPVYRAMMKRVGRTADLIITVSDSTRRDVLQHLDVPAARHDRVVTIPEAADDAFRPAATPATRTRPRILYVGRRDPYKNVSGLIEAFAKVRARGLDAVLKIIGSDDPRYPDAPIRARELGVYEHIEWAGYVSDRDLPAHYQDADVFALVSKYEGFGLTVLEAMGCGTPVVCSNISSLPEVAGDAALTVDPNDTDAIAAALARVLTDSALAADLGRRGIARAAQFSWQRTAELTLAAYERAAV